MEEAIPHLQAAVSVVERACQLCLNVRAGILDDGEMDEGDARLKKQDATPVTVADFGVQALISLELRQHFPDVPLLGEEDATQLRDQLKTQGTTSGTLAEAISTAVASVAPPALGPINIDQILDAIDNGRAKTAPQKRFWILDPIDGTRGFLRGGDSQYVIALALVEDGEVVLGVCGCPNMSLATLHREGCAAGEGPVNGESAQKIQRNQGEGRSCAEPWGPLGSERRGIVVYASRGKGTWVQGLGVSVAVTSTTDTSAGDQSGGPESGYEGESGAGSQAQPRQVRVDGVKRLWDARICISDHERWRELPLAAALASKPHPEDSEDEEGHLHHEREWEAKQLPLCCGSKGCLEMCAFSFKDSNLSLLVQQERPPHTCSICKYVAVALGAASVFVQHPVSKPTLKVWDHAAALICVLEAGGHVTDFDGRPLQLGTGESEFTPGGGGVIVSNGRLHGPALSAVKKGQRLLAESKEP